MQSITLENRRVTATNGSGAVAAVRKLYLAHAADVHRYAARRVGADLADDIVAETFRRAIESFVRFDSSRGHERGWLFGIATNVLRKHRRSELRRLAATAKAAAAVPAGGDPLLARTISLDAEDELERVLDAIARLSDEDFDLLVLVVWEELTSREVATVLDIPPGTVRSRLHRIRADLDRVRSRADHDHDGSTR